MNWAEMTEGPALAGPAEPSLLQMRIRDERHN